ncbi:5'-AMP-activated protein kinase subunit beta-2-like isoform X1 [Hydractinia symbiolongicarpus]|uniref:5'-AMP-activated protein kinase subunit beta-2-like isoform X1 n=1 Tax=Hydractinia symbiolongicarpus TaxID=13093 RepID=UPI00254F238E|nr:5'-AMP-activated protein kinase subunit beta-2-like isoform X1 [Hydractinia symbiolongicarpus]
MGQTQSTPQRQRQLSTSDSTLDFESGKKTKTDDIAFTAYGAPTSEDSHHITQRVVDDGGEGYVPTEVACHKMETTVPVVFHWEYGGKEVYLSGSFNDWKTRIPMTFSGGEFAAIIELPRGTHQFKYLVDGNWIHDPNQKTIDDTFGGRNNVIVVKESDFDATEALLKDECGSNLQSVASTSSLRHSPPGSYGQLIPPPNVTLIHDNFNAAVIPPSLPPHLLNVILNKDSVDGEDPTLLPVPNHVALNHLYALSIKDSVMTLSATHRYKRKYVTTILYKPIKVN